MSIFKNFKSICSFATYNTSNSLKNFNCLKEQWKLKKAKPFLIISLILLGYNLSFAQAGSLDSSFNPGTGTDIGIITTAIQSDGKIIIGGYFTVYNGTTSNHIARLNTDGSFDNSFNLGTGADNFIESISIQNDGKIIIGGFFTSYNGTVINHIARLNTDGTLDTSFDTGSGADDTIKSISVQSDGKIIICGNFSSYNDIARKRIARLNTDGSLDTSFDPGTGAEGYLFTSKIQSDGKIIIGGDIWTYNNTPINKIARLNTDGSLDTSFNTGIGANYSILTNSIQSDGKIIIGGEFTSYNDSAINRIARLNTDGSLDTSFDPGTGTNAYVFDSSIQSDGKIIIVGDFNTFNATSRNRIARLNTDGSLDTSFETGTGANGWVWAVSIQTDGEIIIGGSFTHYDGVERQRIARIISGTTMGIQELIDEKKKIIIFPNPFSKTTTLFTKDLLNNATLTVYNSLGQPVKEIKNISGQTTLLHRGNLTAGMYFIRLLHDNQIMMTDKLLITD